MSKKIIDWDTLKQNCLASLRFRLHSMRKNVNSDYVLCWRNGASRRG